MARISVEVESKGIKQTEKDLKGLGTQGKKAEAQMGKVSAASSGLGRNMGQAGIQVQQFVGQVQGGQSALLALSQQSADLGIVLGAPLVGVITALAASVAGILAPSLFEAEDSASALKETLKSLDDVFVKSADGSYLLSSEIAELARVSEQAAKVQLALTLTEAQQALVLASDAASEAITEFDTLFNGFEVAARGLDDLDSAAKRTGLSFDELFDDTYATGFGQLASFTEELSDAMGVTTEQAVDMVRAFSDFQSGGSISELASTFSDISLNSSGATREFQELAVTLNELSATTLNSEQRIELATELLKNLGVTAENAETPIKNLVDTYNLKTKALGLTEEAQDRLIASVLLGDDATAKEIDAVNKTIDAYYKKKNAIDEATEAEEKQGSIDKQVESLQKRYDTEFELLEQRKALVLQSSLSEQEQMALIDQLQGEYFDKKIERVETEKQAEIQAQKEITSEEEKAARQRDILANQRVSALNSTTSQLKATLGEQNDLYKAAAITNTTIATYESATQAYKALAGIPVVGPALGTAAAGVAVAAGLANVASIQSARMQGGQVTAGVPYQVGERGVETFIPNQSGKIAANGTGESTGMTVNVYNQTGSSVQAVENESGGTDIYITRDEFQDGLTAAAQNPNSGLNQGLQSTYKMERN